MFIRAFTALFSVVALAGLATAAPGGGGSSQCDTGSIQCCSSYQSSDTQFIQEFYGYMGLPLPAPGTQVGFTCSPITVGGLGSGSTCTSQPVCCNGDNFNGVVVSGCNPTTVNV